MVYDDWDPAVHLLDPFAIPDDWRRFRAIDFGYTNPFCCQWWAVDGDGRMYLYREVYMTRRTVREHARTIAEYSDGERIEATVGGLGMRRVERRWQSVAFRRSLHVRRSR